MRTVFLFLFFLGFGLNPVLLAQGQILCMNGREIQAGFLDFKPAAGVVYYQKKAGKGPIKAIPAYSVFSFTDSINDAVKSELLPTNISTPIILTVAFA